MRSRSMGIRPALTLLTLSIFTSVVNAQTPSGPLQILNPNWNITLTSAGYSDWLYDNTPGFQGREYLSGEWGAAVAYTVGTGGLVVPPTWLEPNFSFPDWQTNSTFTTLNDITPTAFDAGGLPTSAASAIVNSHLQIDLAYEMVDTLLGMKLGTAPMSASTGSSVDSNRYVLKQTYTIRNISGSDIHDLRLFQLLHALNGVTSLYDNRSYSGPLAEYQYDTTQVAIDATYSGGTGPTFRDYIGFGSNVPPAAFDNGRYGIEGIDDHATGKPGVGVHISIENDTLVNLDDFSPTNPVPWIAGAQKYALGSLAPGASVSFSLMLSVKTGTSVQTTGPCSGSANGGSTNPGGVDYVFDDVTEIGDFFAEYDGCDASELAARVAAGEFTAPTFQVPGTFQLYELEFDGVFAGSVRLTFGYDVSLLPVGFNESLLGVQQFLGGAWHSMGGTVDPLAHTITVTVSSLSEFALGIAPGIVTRSIDKWRSVRTHGNIGPVSVTLNPVAAGNGGSGPTVEGRGLSSTDCGIRQIEVDFDGPITLADPSNITMIGQTTAEGVLGPVTAYTPTSVTVDDSSTLVILFNPGVLPDQSCYTITIGAGTLDQAIEGDVDCSVRSLFGDTNMSGEVNLSDALIVKAMIGKAVVGHAQYDVDLSGIRLQMEDAVFVKDLVMSPSVSALCP